MDLATHVDRRLADRAHQRQRPLDHFRRREWRARHLDQRHQVWRIDRVRDDAARAARETCGDRRGRECRGRTGEDRLRRRQRIHLGVEPLLHFQPLDDALLHEARAGERLVPATAPRGRAPRSSRALVDQPLGLQVGELAGTHSRARCRCDGLGIVQLDLAAGAREHDRPAGADQPGADQRDMRRGARAPGAPGPGGVATRCADRPTPR